MSPEPEYRVDFPTLFVAVEWIEAHCVIPDGFRRGEPFILSGWQALTRAVAKDGRVGWVQQVSDRPDTVDSADTQFYGVGAFLLAASAVAQLKPEMYR